jgi:hypothetical protein
MLSPISSCIVFKNRMICFSFVRSVIRYLNRSGYVLASFSPLCNLVQYFPNTLCVCCASTCIELPTRVTVLSALFLLRRTLVTHTPHVCECAVCTRDDAAC